MRSHDDMRPILRTCQIFRELVGHVPTNRITMKNLHRGRIGELSELLNPRFFDQQFGWLQQQHVPALLNELARLLHEVERFTRPARRGSIANDPAHRRLRPPKTRLFGCQPLTYRSEPVWM